VELANHKQPMINLIRELFSQKQKTAFTDFANRLSVLYRNAPIDFGGGCSYEKALALGFYIRKYNYQSSIDIGVYRGRSLFPQALAHRRYSKGLVYAVDPYDNAAAVQNDRAEIKQQLKAFANNTDFSQIYKDVTKQVAKHKLSPFVKFIRDKSQNAAKAFEKDRVEFGLIHIDGNHDTAFVMQDVADYFPLLQKGGIIILDDISWDSVKPAYAFLEERMAVAGTCIDDQNDFAVFIDKSVSERLSSASQLLQEIKSFCK
jgi:hypothetical protein